MDSDELPVAEVNLDFSLASDESLGGRRRGMAG